MYAVFASLSDIIGSEDEPLPEDLHENIMAGVRRSAMINHNKRRLSKPMRNTLAAAACAALVLFAARGLAPADKARDAMLNESQAAAMDASIQTKPEESAAEAAPAVSPAVTAAPVPTATVQPTASPVPTRDVYLGSGEDKIKSDEAKNNSNNKNTTDMGGSVLITEPPQEIVVSTPAPTPKPVATPRPTPEPTPVPTPAATPSPLPTASEAPAAPATASLEAAAHAAPEAETVSPADGAMSDAGNTASGGAEAMGTQAAAETEAPAPSDTPEPRKSLKSMFASMFSLGGASEDAAAPAALAEPESEGGESLSPVPSPVAAPEEEAPAEEAAEEAAEEELLIELRSLEKLEELENLLDGQEAELPEEQPGESYSFCLYEPDELFEDYKLTVHICGETVYYDQFFSPDESISCVSECSVEDFEKFLDSLSDEEKAPLLVSPSPSPTPSATPESPAPGAEASVQPSGSPEPSAEPETKSE